MTISLFKRSDIYYSRLKYPTDNLTYFRNICSGNTISRDQILKYSDTYDIFRNYFHLSASIDLYYYFAIIYYIGDDDLRRIIRVFISKSIIFADLIGMEKYNHYRELYIKSRHKNKNGLLRFMAQILNDNESLFIFWIYIIQYYL
jgi:hypothetical protein